MLRRKKNQTALQFISTLFSLLMLIQPCMGMFSASESTEQKEYYFLPFESERIPDRSGDTRFAGMAVLHGSASSDAPSRR